ncbi:TolC family protein, partial [Arthrospira platensis SPKY1]|nr:TolC family protein [Arthrospira platensis SPKY1]
HPAYRIEEERKEQAQIEQELKRQNFRPSISLGLENWFIGASGMNESQRLLMPMVSLMLPIQREKVRAEIRQSEAKIDQSNALQQAIQLELEQARNRILSAWTQ